MTGVADSGLAQLRSPERLNIGTFVPIRGEYPSPGGWSAASGRPSNPSAMATFGIYPSPAARIYQRETY